jgi:hypothetical protein
MTHHATPTRILITDTILGLAVSELVSYALVWSWLDAYRWNPDGTLNRYPFALRPKTVETDPVTGEKRVVDPAGTLARSERMRTGCEESAPIVLFVTFLGFCGGLIHLRVRESRRAATLSAECRDYEDSTGRFSGNDP